MTRKRGTCVLVGLPLGEFPVPLFDVVATALRSAVRSSALARIWPKPSPLLSEARLEPILSCNLYLRSIKSLTGSNTAMCHHAWYSTSRKLRRRSSIRKLISISQRHVQRPQEICNWFRERRQVAEEDR
jgi:hypothetical protein